MCFNKKNNDRPSESPTFQPSASPVAFPTKVPVVTTTTTEDGGLVGGNDNGGNENSDSMPIIIGIAIASVCLLGAIIFVFCKMKKKNNEGIAKKATVAKVQSMTSVTGWYYFMNV